MPVSPNDNVLRRDSMRNAFRQSEAALHDTDVNQRQIKGIDGKYDQAAATTAARGAELKTKAKPVDLDEIFNANYLNGDQAKKAKSPPPAAQPRQQQRLQTDESPPVLGFSETASPVDKITGAVSPKRSPPSPPAQAPLPTPLGQSPVPADSPARDFFAKKTTPVTAPNRPATPAGNGMLTTTTTTMTTTNATASPVKPSLGYVSKDMLTRFEGALKRDVATLGAHADTHRQHAIERSWRHADHCACGMDAAATQKMPSGARRAASADQRVLLVVDAPDPRAVAMSAAIDAFEEEVVRLTHLVEQAEADLDVELRSSAASTTRLQQVERHMWGEMESLGDDFRAQRREARNRIQGIFDSILPTQEACEKAERHLASITVTCGKCEPLAMSHLGAAKRIAANLHAAETNCADTTDCLEGLHDQVERELQARRCVRARLEDACDDTSRELESAEGALKRARSHIHMREVNGGLASDLRCGKAVAAVAQSNHKQVEGDGVVPMFSRLAALERRCGHLCAAGAHLRCLRCASTATNREASALHRQLSHAGAVVHDALGELDANVAAAERGIGAAAVSRHEPTAFSPLVDPAKLSKVFDAVENGVRARREDSGNMQRAVRQLMSPPAA